MALKEISDLIELAAMDDTAWMHVKLGGVDYKSRPQVLFDLYNSQTAGNSANRSVTKAEVGLGNVSDNAQLTIANDLSDLNNITTARTNLSVNSIAEIDAKILAFTSLTNNPNSVTKAQVSLGNVPNYTITSTITDTSTSKFATINAVAQVNTRVTNLEPNIIPALAVMMWPENAPVPAGWLAMDGTNGTVDMRGKFPRGGSLAPGATQVGTEGGSDVTTHTHTGTATGTSITLAQSPAHNHQNGTRLQRADDGGREVVVVTADPDFNDEVLITGMTGGPANAAEGDSDPHGHAVTVAANAAVAGNNIPTFYTMIFIQKT